MRYVIYSEVFIDTLIRRDCDYIGRIENQS